jgi:hypothetical protein
VPRGQLWPDADLLRQLEELMLTKRGAVSFEYPHFAEAMRAFEQLMRARE